MWVYLRVNTETVTDYVTSWNTAQNGNSTNFYWVRFTALKSWTIKWVIFWISQTVGTLKIAEGDYADENGTEYNISTSIWNYYFNSSEEFSIVEWKNYVISFKNTNWYYLAANTWITFPISWDAVRYDYWTISTAQTQYTDRSFAINWLIIDYID